MKQADGSTVSTKDMMVVYFNRIQDLMKNEALDSRHRFMLNDLVDLRNNNWVERRKVSTSAEYVQMLTNICIS